MTFTKDEIDGKITLKLSGMLDTANSVEFETIMTEASDATSELTVDFSGIEYISSSGLRVLLKIQKKMAAKGTMIICNVNNAVKEVFDLTGFSEILTVK